MQFKERNGIWERKVRPKTVREREREREREVIKASKKLIEKRGCFSTTTTVHLKHTSLSSLWSSTINEALRWWYSIGEFRSRIGSSLALWGILLPSQERRKKIAVVVVAEKGCSSSSISTLSSCCSRPRPWVSTGLSWAKFTGDRHE